VASEVVQALREDGKPNKIGLNGSALREQILGKLATTNSPQFSLTDSHRQCQAPVQDFLSRRDP